MTAKLSGPMIPSKNAGTPRQAVVLLHGYGSDGQDLIGLAAYWRDQLPDAMFIAPNAPQPCRDNPSGYQWFPADSGDPEYRAVGVARARPIIAEYLGHLWRQTGLSPSDTLLAGFSQGAMMALHVGMSLDDVLMGVVSFSGALVAPKGFPDHDRPRPRICLVHGELDRMLDPELSVTAATILRDKGFDVRLHIQPGAGHTISPDGLAFAGEFMAAASATKPL